MDVQYSDFTVDKRANFFIASMIVKEFTLGIYLRLTFDCFFK
jgi:hypothetical protein